MPVGSEVRGPQVRRLDSRDTVEGIVITGENLDGASRSGSGGGDVWTESPPRDPAKGKGPVVMEETSGEVSVEQAEFRPTAGSLGHRPITRGCISVERSSASIPTSSRMGMSVVSTHCMSSRLELFATVLMWHFLD